MTINKSCRKTIAMLLSIMLLFGILLDCQATAFAYDEPILDAPAAVAVDHRAGNVLYKKNEDIKVQIGALTNMMVALVAMDNKNCDGALMRSIDRMLGENADASINRIVRVTCGANNQSLFIKKMNKKAKALGCKNTKFIEVYGYGDVVTLADKNGCKNPNANVSTMADIAKITMAFLNNPKLNKMVSMNKKKDDIQYGVLTEGDGQNKGNCGVIVGKKDDSQFSVISVGGVAKKINKAEGVELLMYVFDNYRTYQVFSKGNSTGKIKIKGGERNYVKVYAKEDLYVDLPKEGEESLLETRSVVEGDVVAPVEKGTVVGKMEVLEAGEVTATVPIIVGSDVKKGGPLSKIGISDYMLKYMGCILGGLLVIFIIIRIRIGIVKKKRRERMKRKRRAEAMRIARERQEKRERGWPID